MLIFGLYFILSVRINNVATLELYDVTGDIELVSTKTFKKHGDTLSYKFRIVLPQNKEVSDIKIYLNNAPIYAEISSLDDLSCVYEDSSGKAYSLNDPILKASKSIEDYQLVIKLPRILSERGTLKGTVDVKITGDARSGARIHCLVAVFYSLNSEPYPEPIYLLSNDVYMAPPSFDIVPSAKRHVGIRERVSFQSQMDLQDGITDLSGTVVMPSSIENLEAFMSVKEVTVKSVNQAVISDVDKPDVVYYSEMNNSVSSVADINFDLLQIDSRKNDTGSEVTMDIAIYMEECEAKMYGNPLRPGIGFKFGSSLVWVGQFDMMPNKSHDLRVDIDPQLELYKYDGYDGLMNLSLEARFVNVNSSNAYAHNLTAVIYLPPFVSDVSYLSSYSKARNTVATLRDGKCVLGASQVLFTTDTWIEFNLTLSGDDDRYWKTTKIMLVMDTWYNDLHGRLAYSNITRLVVDLEAIRKHTAQRLHWTKPTKCRCAHDRSKTTCPCCHIGGCQCGAMNPSKCSDCKRPWQCHKQVKEFSEASKLDLSGETIMCRPYQRYRYQKQGMSCFTNKYGGWSGLSPIVSNIIGIDSQSGNLFGITNNGHGYVVSEDGGREWMSITPSYLSRVKAKDSYKAATFYGYEIY